MIKHVFNVFLDDYSIHILANNEEEVMDLCFKCFEYSTLSIEYIKDMYTKSDFPQFIGDLQHAS